jgi:hypothetical protein
MLKTKLHFEQIPVANVLKIATRPILRGHGMGPRPPQTRAASFSALRF